MSCKLLLINKMSNQDKWINFIDYVTSMKLQGPLHTYAL